MTTSPQENPYKTSGEEDPLQDAQEYRDHFEDEEEFQEALAIWPVCPQCGRRRITTCPICHVSGTLFPLADDEYWAEEAPQSANEQDTSGQAGCGPKDEGERGCSCGGSCGNNPLTNYDRREFPSLMAGELEPGLSDFSVTSPYFAPYLTGQNPKIELEQNAVNELMNIPVEHAESAKALPGKKEIRLLACYVCSEPFVPHFAAKCEWCGHHFDEKESAACKETSSCIDLNESVNSENNSNESEEQDIVSEDIMLPTSHNREEINPRILLVFIGMAILAAGAMAYLFFLF